MWPIILALAGGLAMVLACGYAIVRGDRPARWCGILVACAWIGSFLLQDRQHNHAPQYAVAGLDVLLSLAFLALTLRFRRLWLVVASASQLLTAATHVAFVLDPRILALGFMTAYYVWSYITLIALVWGSIQAVRARRAVDNSHRTSVRYPT
ncbi:MAG: hypothetical protein KF842_08040 [Caulobacter sp.]|nr:hypothetical protein [Caulobacter sp.]